jgi:hypothetical protein
VLSSSRPDESITLADTTAGLHSFRGVFDAGVVSTVSVVRLDRVGRNHNGLHLAAHVRNQDPLKSIDFEQRFTLLARSLRRRTLVELPASFR